MSIEFKLPDLGETEKADIGQVLVKEGDVLDKEQIILELETDKAVLELPCPHAGKITKIHVKAGDTVKVGSPILTLEESDGEAPGKNGAKEKEAAPPAKQQEKGSKEQVKKDLDQQQEPKPQATRAAVQDDIEAPGKSTPGLATAPVIPERDDQTAPAPAGPATRRLARELGVDLHQVNGSGPGGRITQEDVQEYIRGLTSGATRAGGSGGISAPPLPDFSQWGQVERKPMNKVAKTTANNLSAAWQMIPHVTQHELADITELEAGRKRQADAAKGKKDGAPKVTMTVLAMKAVVAALKAYPHFNASYDGAAGEVILKRYYNLGIAVDTENGLLVPVIRDVDKKSVLELAAELGEIAEKARAKKLDLAAMRGGTFTISNLGGIGGTGFTPIVNYPEVAILGMSRARWEQVIRDGKPENRLMLPLSLSYDHRVINGADGARFAGKLAALLSDPFQLLSEC